MSLTSTELQPLLCVTKVARPVDRTTLFHAQFVSQGMSWLQRPIRSLLTALLVVQTAELVPLAHLVLSVLPASLATISRTTLVLAALVALLVQEAHN